MVDNFLIFEESDNSSSKSFQEIMTPPSATLFKHSKDVGVELKDEINVYWLRFDLVNQDTLVGDWLA